MKDWDSLQYLKYKKERTQPAVDLVNRISLANPTKIIDIGCGPGNSTAVLAKKYTNAYILGVDCSQDMIETAKKEYPNLNFMMFNAETDFSNLSERFDIVFSSACIQWIPNHKSLLNQMMQVLTDGGIMAIQIPINYHEPMHKIIKEIVRSKKWSSYFSNARCFYTLTSNEYFDILSSISSDFTIWETTYYHRMKSYSSIMEWYRGTGLRPYLSVLNKEEQHAFEKDILCALSKVYPVQSNGEIIFRFPRLFLIANK